jgi:acylphosphatase
MALVRVTGRVQGVGFRAWTRGEAVRLGLTGWVRNEPDGSVLTLLVGREEAVAQMIQRLRVGPRGAAVSGIERLQPEAGDIPQGFAITR